MEDCLKIKATKEVIEGILAIYKGINFIQCTKCSGVKFDAQELSKALYEIEQKTSDASEDFFVMLGEECGDLLRKIIDIGMPRECCGNNEFYDKWFAANKERQIYGLDDFEEETFIKSRDVVLYVNDACACAMFYKT